MTDIRIADEKGASGLATMLQDLLKQNINNSPIKKWDLRLLNLPVAIVAEDVDISLTLKFRFGVLTIHEGIVGRPWLTIKTTSEDILELSLINITFGLPNFTDKRGREILKKILYRKIKIKGMVFHPVSLLFLTRLVSVNG